MTETNPNNWVMIKMTYKEFVTYKVLGDVADSWRLLSHVKSVDTVDGKLKFTGFHDAVYNVDPNKYGLNENIEPIWNIMNTTHNGNVELLENRDWITFDFEGKQ